MCKITRRDVRNAFKSKRIITSNYDDDEARLIFAVRSYVFNCIGLDLINRKKISTRQALLKLYGQFVGLDPHSLPTTKGLSSLPVMKD